MKEIILTKGSVAIVDDADFEWLNQWKWYASGGKYAARRDAENGRCLIYMHRVIVNPNDGLHVDHINHNSLDNRRENLRPATHSQNMANSRHRTGRKTPYRGVRAHNGGRQWVAHIRNCGRSMHIACCKTPEEAARAFDREALRIFGEFAMLNFPEEHGLAANA